MKKILLLELCFLFLATTFQGDRLTGWVQQTIPRPDLPVLGLQFVDSLNGFFVSSKYSPSDSAFIFKTINGGNNWSTSLIDNIYLTSIQFIDNNLGFSVGRDVIPINGLIKITTNGGLNWATRSIISGSGVLEDVCFSNKDTGWVCSRDLTAGGLWRTTNGGQNWQLQLNYDYRPSKIFFVNSNTGWVIGNSGVNLYKTINSGVNWNLQYIFGSYDISDLFFVTNDTGWVIGGGGGNGIMRSINGGNNWNPCNNPTPYGTAKLFFINNKVGWVGSGLNRILATKNGFDWVYQSSPIFNNYNISFVDSSKGWAGSSGLVHTTDGGGPIVSINQTVTEVPKDFVLEQNYPNPFNSSTVISVQLPAASVVTLKVYDVQGREVQTLVDKRLNPGVYEYIFNGSNLTSGIYFYALFSDGLKIDTKKAILIK